MVYVVRIDTNIFAFDVFDEAMDFAETAKYMYVGKPDITVTITIMRDDELQHLLDTFK